MSFFDVPTPPPEPEPEPEAERLEPPWFGPPKGVLPGYSQQKATIFKTNENILFLNDFRAYPNGLMFSLNLVLRKQNEDVRHMPWETHRRHRRPDRSLDDLLRFGIRFADGSKWTNLDQQTPDPSQEPDRPFVWARSSSGGVDRFRSNYWMWPLPSNGPLTFVASWPAYEVPESTATIDGTELLRCAEAAEVIWPN